MKNYFTLFDLEPSFEIDEVALQKTYFKLQQEYHPDRQATAADEDKQRAILLSMDINQGYDTLKDKVKRAQHLLALHGISVNSENDNVKADTKILMEMMELREALEDASSHRQLAELYERTGMVKKDVIKTITAAFAEDSLERAAMLVIKLNYVEKFLRDVKITMQKKFPDDVYEFAANT